MFRAAEILHALPETAFSSSPFNAVQSTGFSKQYILAKTYFDHKGNFLTLKTHLNTEGYH